MVGTWGSAGARGSRPMHTNPLAGSQVSGSGNAWGRARLLFIDSDHEFRRAVTSSLGSAGWQIEDFASAEEALAVFGRSAYDLVVLDLGPSGVPGTEVLRQLRSRSDVPIVVTADSSNVDDPVVGFDLGADDYIVKPFEVTELDRRIRAILRRTIGPRPDDVLHGPGDIRLLPRAHEAYVGGGQVYLTPKEFEVLRVLLSRRGEVVPPDHLSVEIWGYETFGSRNYVEAHVSRLRTKLADAGAPGVIQTVRGVGYLVR